MHLQSITRGSAFYNEAVALLTSYELETSDLTDSEVLLWSMEDQGQLVAVIGMELSMEIGLLRSLAVSKNHQGSGIARMLCQVVFEYAKINEIQQLFLLTETASGFFESQGFSEVSRNNAPEALRATKQFSSLCPDSAIVMARDL